MALFEELNVGRATVGPGGTVTQGTSTVTGVTLNKLSGQITTYTSSAAAGANASFTVTNSMVKAKSVVLACVASTSSAGLPVAFVTAVAAGSFVVTVRNIHASDALNNTMVINFVVLNGS